MAEPTKRKRWSDVKARLETLDRKGLVSLLGELYDANVANRRFLHSRMTPGSRDIEEYRGLVADAIYPDPFSKRRVSVRDAAAIIVEVPTLHGGCIRDRRPHADVGRGWNGASCGSGQRRRSLLRRAADPTGRRGEGVRRVAGGRPRERESPPGPESKCAPTMSAGASAMLLTNWCTHSTFAQPESGPAKLIDADRDGGRGGSSLISVVQPGARRHGIPGIHGNPGTVESATCRF